MTEETKNILIVYITVVLVVSSIVWGLSFYYTTTTSKAIEQGYSKQTLQGVEGVHWVAPDKKESQ